MGDTICEPYKPLVVQISTEFARSKKYGFGFIVGERNSHFYIVTANHVVRNNEPDNPLKKVWLRFYCDSGAKHEAKLLDHWNKRLDIALLRIKKDDIVDVDQIVWKQQSWCRRWHDEEKVWFIGKQNSRDFWFVPPDATAGTMLVPEADEDGFFYFELRSVQTGSSGAPLITEQGIVGMVKRDAPSESVGVSVNLIRRFVRRNRYPWNLIEHGITNPEPDTSSQNNSLPAAGAVTTEQITGMELVFVPEGCFQMGSPDGEKDRAYDEGLVHKVCVDGFRMGKYEITQGQWRKIMGKNPAEFQHGDNYPVEQVSWDDTQAFIRKLNNKTGKQFRLPTEAEWEYAARAGTTTARHWGDDISCGKAMYENDPGSSEDSCVDYVRTKGLTPDSTAPVGSYPPNQLGLYDMLGNVWEWCNDWYAEKYYDSSPEKNPQGSATGSYRVIRGGGWSNAPGLVRLANRYRDSPDFRTSNLGFRLLLPGQ